MDFQRQMQQGLSIQASKVKAKRRKAEKIEIHGGFMVRATGSRDRHSKVCTARGSRERRVRLSPRTAIQFYDVQDRLGYDRPSEAIDWLMKEAKAAIDSLDAEAKIQQIEIESGIMKSELEMIQRCECLHDQNVISNLSFLGDDFNQDDSILSTYSSQILNTNFDLERLQRFFTWNCTNANSVNPREETETFIGSPHHHFQAPPILSSNQLFSQREPLQSSVFDYSPTRAEFPGILHVAGDEFPYCTTEKEHEGDTSPVPNKPFSAATFLQHEGR